jgi:hypothetical protein
MAALREAWRLPDGNWTLVQDLDREDLAAIAPAIPQWLAHSRRPFGGSEDVASFEDECLFD